MRPLKGTISAKIWEIAESLSRPNFRAHRDEIVKNAVALGVHEKTASTQFGAWDRHNHPELDGIIRRSTFAAKPKGHLAPTTLSTVSPSAAAHDRHWAGFLKNGFKYKVGWQILLAEDLILHRPAPASPGV